MKLLSDKNFKVDKGRKFGYLTKIMHLKPSKVVCPFASKGCMAACLNTAGHGAFSTVQNARTNRTKFYLENPNEFKACLKAEILKQKKTAEKLGLKLAIRLNGTSDLNWLSFIKSMPDIQFYDYTKNPHLMLMNHLPNYDLTFSMNEANELIALKLLKEGKRIAVVFRNELPETWNGFKVIDSDNSDLRFIEPHGVIVGLRAKGKAKKDKSGFVKE